MSSAFIKASRTARSARSSRCPETKEGLLVEGELNLKNPRAVEMYEAMLTDALDGMSSGSSTSGRSRASP
jgi:phage head maturation protease